ncbi:hypothetical protein A4A49_03720 [Nicotiana attenuata]|uniref:Uncharacterized protein n=1 Tax=Nicotiana attenuata TaxID=49451 RepID=A0A314L5B0_NICAT|nr:hypothetical protein A4A49_03720 [Nicotiana attenuata]
MEFLKVQLLNLGIFSLLLAPRIQIGNDQDTTAAREIIGKPAVGTPTAVALNSSVDDAISRSVKQAAAVDHVEKPSGPKATGVLVDGQVLNTPRQFATTQSKSFTKSNNWTVVNKSPSKKQSPGFQKSATANRATSRDVNMGDIAPDSPVEKSAGLQRMEQATKEAEAIEAGALIDTTGARCDGLEAAHVNLIDKGAAAIVAAMSQPMQQIKDRDWTLVNRSYTSPRTAKSQGRCCGLFATEGYKCKFKK